MAIIGSVSFKSFGEFDYDEKILTMERYEERSNVIDTTSLQIIYAHIMYDKVLGYKDIKYDILSIGKNNSIYDDL